MSKENPHALCTQALTFQSFIHQYDEELDEVKRARRPGRPASTREDLLKNKIKLLETEHEQGFCESSDREFRAQLLTYG